MRGTMKDLLTGFILILILTGIATVTVADGITSADLGTNGSLPLLSGGEGSGFVNLLLEVLGEAGLNLSYGSDGGTIFSMVDVSLTRIITDLSSGNTEGFTGIPLINETLIYLHISPEDIIVDPEDVQGSMPALDSYTSRYGHRKNSS
jgi:hypothetical protein